MPGKERGHDMRKVCLYIRVSSEEQARVHEGSLISQRHRLEEYVRARNLIDSNWGKITAVFVDEARSGKNTNRPQYQEMLKAVEQKKVDTILVTELSRLSRSIKDFCALWDFLKAKQAQFLSLREQFDTTSAAGEMMMFSIMNFAQFERMQTSERVSANFEARASRGLVNGGLPSLGFDLIPEKKGTFTINVEEAAAVRRIFETFQEMGSLAATLRCLNKQGLTTKRHLKKDGTSFGGKEWTLNALWRVLRNRHYLGEREVYRKGKQQPDVVKALWPAIISQHLFDSVQNILKTNHLRYKPESTRTFDYIYSSLVFCSQCHASLIGISSKGRQGKKYVYYAHKKKSTTCTIVRADAEKLHELLRRRFRNLANNEALIQRLYQDADLQKVFAKPEREERLDGIKKELRKLQNSASNLLDQIQAWTSSEVPNLLQERLQSLETRIVSLEGEQENLKLELSSANENGVDAKELFNFVKSLDKNFSKLTAAERKQFVRAFIGRIEIHPEELQIHYNYSRDYLAVATQVLGNKAQNTKTKPQPGSSPGWGLFTDINGSGGGTRTPDQMINSHLLYRLSYS